MRLFIAALFLGPSLAIANCTEDAMLVFDASASMAWDITEPDRATRIDEARAALHRALPAIAQHRRLGLVVYGPGEFTGCSHVRVVMPPTADAAERIIGDIDALTPDGATALTRAVQAAVQVLAEAGQPGTVVLVTDGDESCGGQTCALASAIAVQAPGLTVHVVGFRPRLSFGQRDPRLARTPRNGPVGAACLAERTGGLYVTPATIDELVTALNATLGCWLGS